MVLTPSPTNITKKRAEESEPPAPWRIHKNTTPGLLAATIAGMFLVNQWKNRGLMVFNGV